MKLDEQQLMDAQIIIVNEEECNDHIMDILTTCDNYKEAIDVVEDYIYDECDCYLQEINTGVGFHSTREEATAIAKVVLTHFGWEEPKQKQDGKQDGNGITPLNNHDKQQAITFILRDEKEYSYIVDKLFGLDFETAENWLYTRIHGGLDSFFSDKFRRRICTGAKDINEIVIQLLSHFGYNKSHEVLREEINQHIQNAEEIINSVETQLKGKNIMPTVTVKTVHFVNDVDVKQMNRDKLHNSIKELEDEIKSLRKIKVKSKSVTLAIKEAKATLHFVVKHVDAKVK